jgi:SAM-dependent methyltransferase
MKELSTIVLVVVVTTGAAMAKEPAAALKEAGITGGLVVHLGCGGGEMTAVLKANDAYVVHGLDTDPANVQEARKRFLAGKFGGSVSAAEFDGEHLPYVDNMVNLLILSSRFNVSQSELMRVLAPGGVLLELNDEGWRKTVKPVPNDIDQWTHYLHGPDNNAVANDKQVGPPRHLQWQGGPKWTRHHDKMSTFSAMVSAGGRIYYIIDEGSMASIMFPPRWALIARDAFNGKILWRRKIDPWFSNFKGLKDGPADVPRRLIATPDRVYATLSISGPLTAMDATTGETVHTYQGTEEAEEVVLSNGTLFVLIGPGSIGDGRRMERPVEKRTILAIDEETGENHWAHADVVAATTMAVDDARLYYFNFDDQFADGTGPHDRPKAMDIRATAHAESPEVILRAETGCG